MTDFEITGPGEYRTRDGRKAEGVHYVGPGPDDSELVWEGYCNGSRSYWASNGRLFPGIKKASGDIIGPWVEPAAALTITITEGTSYFATDGTHTGMGQTRNEAVAALFAARGEGE